LGTPDQGRWRIAPTDEDARMSRRYCPDTLILETCFETATGAATVRDFMPLRDTHSRVIRVVTGVRGRVAFASELVIRFGYGEVVPWVAKTDDGRLRAIAGPDMLLLESSVALHGRNFKTIGDFEIGEGETASFVLSYGLSHLPDPPRVDPMRL